MSFQYRWGVADLASWYIVIAKTQVAARHRSIVARIYYPMRLPIGRRLRLATHSKMHRKRVEIIAVSVRGRMSKMSVVTFDGCRRETPFEIVLDAI